MVYRALERGSAARQHTSSDFRGTALTDCRAAHPVKRSGSA
jgi:hypothetical protein